MSLTRRICCLLCTLLLTPMLASAQSKEEARLLQATAVVEELNAMPDQRAPDWLLARAHGIAVIPNVVKVGLGIGGRGGKGAMVVRTAQGGWSNPVFITLGGGSFGWQAGVQSADLLLVLTTRAKRRGNYWGQSHSGRRCLRRRGSGRTADLGGNRHQSLRDLLLFTCERPVCRHRDRRLRDGDRQEGECNLLWHSGCESRRHLREHNASPAGRAALHRRARQGRARRCSGGSAG